MRQVRRGLEVLFDKFDKNEMRINAFSEKTYSHYARKAHEASIYLRRVKQTPKKNTNQDSTEERNLTKPSMRGIEGSTRTNRSQIGVR